MNFTEEEAGGWRNMIACPGHRKAVAYLTSESQALTVVLFVVTQWTSQRKGSGIFLGISRVCLGY